MYKLDRKLTGRSQLRKYYFVLTGAATGNLPMLYCYKTQEAWQRRDKPEKVRVRRGPHPSPLSCGCVPPLEQGPEERRWVCVGRHRTCTGHRLAVHEGEQHM